MACILCLVISFLDKGMASLNEFDELRARTFPGERYRGDYFYNIKSNTVYNNISNVATSDTSKLYTEVRNWFKVLRDHSKNRNDE